MGYYLIIALAFNFFFLPEKKVNKTNPLNFNVSSVQGFWDETSLAERS